MIAPAARVYFDFVDPLSYVASRRSASEHAATSLDEVAWIGFELRPRPAPLTTSGDPFWRERMEAARPGANELGLDLFPPDLVPWTRKAHELHRHASATGLGAAIRSAIFDAFFREGRDIGRVDVLVDVAASVGLDRTETKAVLDVDRYEAEVADARREALALGVSDIPSHAIDGRVAPGLP